MLNMKAMPAANGGGLAVYLWKEAVGNAYDPLVVLANEVRAEEREYYILQVQGLMLALDVVGERQYRQMIEALSDPDVDEGVFERTTENLAIIWRKMGQAEWADAIDRIVDARDNMLDEQAIAWEAEQRFAELAPDSVLRQTFGVQYRQDTSRELAELLSIDPEAVPQLHDLKNLLSAKRADGERIPGRFYRKDREDQITMGSLELIFSADKSVSVVFGLSSPEERQAIVSGQRNAVDAAMRQVADKIGVIRSRRDGLDKRDPADVTWVQWQHRMSRRGDPQLHTHVSLINVVRSRVDGKAGTLDTFLLHGLYPSIRETYHRALADELGNLGLAVRYDLKAQAAALTAVPQQVLRHFSGRTADAEKAAAEWLQKNCEINFAALTSRQRSAWLTRAAAVTRPSKAMYYVPANGHAAWHARAAGQGYVPPPSYIDPRILLRAGIVYASAQQAWQAQQAAQAPPLTPHGNQADNTGRRQAKKQQPKSIGTPPDEQHGRRGGRYDDDYVLRRGVRL